MASVRPPPSVLPLSPDFAMADGTENVPLDSVMGESTEDGGTKARLEARLGTTSPRSSFSPMSIMRAKSGGGSGDTFVKVSLALLLLFFVIIVILAGVAGHLSTLNPWPNLCSDKQCLRESARMLSVMNTSVDPCTNFYQYACGNWAKKYPPTDFWDQTSWYDILSKNADDSVVDVLEDRVIHDASAESAEAKGKTFFHTCTDTYKKTSMGGGPVIDDIKMLGGWAALPGTGWWFGRMTYPWQLNRLLQSAHTLYGSAPFFQISVVPDYVHGDQKGDAETWIPELLIPSLPADWYRYNSNDSYSLKIMAAYEAFVLKYTTLLATDAGMDPTRADIAAAINQSVADVLYMEKSIAFIISHTVPGQDEDSYATYSQIDAKAPGVVDWSGLLTALFPKSGFTQNTLLDLHELDFMNQITALVGKMLNGTRDQQRMLNNYMMWQIAYSFHSDLGWEYIHANREWVMAKYGGYVTFLGQYNWCIKQVKDFIPYILDEIYVQAHFDDVAYQQANTLYQNFKDAFTKRLDTDVFSWMTAADRATAKGKLAKTKDKIGYPTWLRDPKNVNSFYNLLTIKRDQHFKNVMAMVQFQIGVEGQKLATHVIDQYQIWDKAIWEVHKPKSWYDPWWNEMFFPAGILQSPILNADVPAFVNFASMGNIVSERLQMVVNLYGSNWDADGKNNPWYSKETQHNWFSQVESCNNKLYVNKTYCYSPQMIDIIIINKEKEPGESVQLTATQPPQICNTVNSITFAYSNIYDVSATDNSFKAYRAYVAANGPESSLPGFPTDNTDEVFLTQFAQGWCVGENPYAAYINNKYYGQTIPELFVNTMVTEVPEFKAAFKCPDTSPLGATNKCPGL